jgi:hypothetical protein
MADKTILKDYAETVRETYRLQGEKRMAKELLEMLKAHPAMTTDYITYYLAQDRKRQ